MLPPEEFHLAAPPWTDAMTDPLSQSLPQGLPPEEHSLELLRRAQAGDDLALRDLLERYQDRLLRIVRIQLAGSPLRRLHDSMDLVQNTFVAALPKIGELRPASSASLLHWLAIIATNKIRDAYGRETADRRDLRRSRPIDVGTHSEVAAIQAAPSAEAPLRAAAEAELRERLDAEVAELPEDQRRVVLLRDYCGDSWERIAVELGREQGAARQLHQRAWIRLRQRLRPFLEERRGTG